MLSLEWRLTLISVLILPLFILAARRMGNRLRDIARQAMDANAQMNAMMNETLNIGGALAGQALWARSTWKWSVSSSAPRAVRDIGINRAVVGTTFFVVIGLLSAVGTALVYGLGGYLAIRQVFTIGTIVAFGAYLTSLYSALQGLANAPVEFATSVVSFERVFEVIDLPAEIEDQPQAIELKDVRGELVFEDVSFRYDPKALSLLSEVQRHGQMHNVTAVLSGGAPAAKAGMDAPSARKRAEDLTAIDSRRSGSEEVDRWLRSQPGAPGCAGRPLLPCPPRATGGAGRAQRRRQNHPHLPDPAPVRSHQRADSASMGTICARSASNRSAPRSAWSPRKPTCSMTPSAPTCCMPSWMPPRQSWKPPAGPPTSTTSSPSCPRVRYGRRRARLPAERRRETAPGAGARHPERPAHPGAWTKPPATWIANPRP